MIKIDIIPNDVLFFRELKPYTAGEIHTVKSNPPLPQTIAGALRTKILVENNFSKDAKIIVGYGEDEPKFEIIGNFFAQHEELFPIPFDLVKTDDDYFFVQPHSLKWGTKILHILKGKSIHFKNLDGFFKRSDLIKYLRGELQEENIPRVLLKEENVYKREKRIGIGLNERKTTIEGMLYQAEFLRLCEHTKLTFWLNDLHIDNGNVDFGDGVKIPLNGIMQLGGERRFVFYKVEEIKSNNNFFDELSAIIKSLRNKMKIYVATPILNKAKDSTFYCDDIKDAIEKKLKIKIINMYKLLGKPVKVGGWDLAKNAPKGLKYAIPAGSVYFVEYEGTVRYNAPYFKLGEFTKLGYGLCFMGIWL